ncbi:MAG: aspartate ammonia-lyase [Thermoanaerobaculia bacterium]|nr:aspartate ammonia-lyase [Thermoanaerobaculia bacterium]
MTRSARIEHDTMGEVEVPEGALWGAQTQRAIANFPVSGLRSHPALIRAYVWIKRAAAAANRTKGALDATRSAAIVAACDALLADERQLRDQFPVDVFQAGAGTSLNMNCNEVIAALANARLSKRRGTARRVHPNDHVNMSQSTNDTFPTAMRLAMLGELVRLDAALDDVERALAAKGVEFAAMIKAGRTHLQDAVPVTLGQEFAAWAAAVARSRRLTRDAGRELLELGIGGTATGTGLNAPRGYSLAMVKELRRLTGFPLKAVADLGEGMQSQLPIAAVSASLRNLALELGRIANDLRLLASGPGAGLGEIRLPAVQPGSSIMPGKVNPSMLECLNQICFHVIGADAAVAYAVQAGQLELNVMMPLMAWEVLFSIDLLANYLPVVSERCLRGIEADAERCASYHAVSPALATVLNPLIGYEAAAAVAKESAATGETVPEIVRRRRLLPASTIRRIFSPSSLAGGTGCRRRG